MNIVLDGISRVVGRYMCWAINPAPKHGHGLDDRCTEPVAWAKTFHALPADRSAPATSRLDLQFMVVK
jgi:hypothetical protein